MSNTVETIFVARDDQSKTVNKLTKGLDRYGNEADEASKKTKKATDSLGGLKNAAISYLSVQMAKKIAIEAVNMAELGAKVEFVDDAFSRFTTQTGIPAEKMMQRLRVATRGATEDIALQQQAMQALASGVDFEDLETAMKFVTRVALSEGKNAAQLMQTTITGLVRGSAQFLDDVHIDVMGSKDVVNDAIAQMEEKMDLFSDSAGTTTGVIAEMKAGFINFKNDLAVQFLPVFEEMIDLYNEFKDSLTTEQIDNFVSSVKIGFGVLLGAGALLASGLNAILSGVDIAINAMIQGVITAVEAVSGFLQEQAQSWATILNAGPLSKVKAFRVLSRDMAEFGSKTSDFNELMNEMSEDSKRRTRESVDGWLERQEALNGFIAKIKDLGKEREKAESEGGGGSTTTDGGDSEDDGVTITQMQVDAEKAMFSELMQWRNDMEIKAWEERQERARQERDLAFDLGTQTLTLFNTIFSKRSQAIDAEAAQERRIAKENIKDQKKLDKELAKIDAEAEERKKKIAIADYIARVAGATGDLAGAVLGVVRDQPGGAISKVAAGLAIAGFGASFLSTVIGSKPQFYNGSNGPINDGSGRTSDGIPALVRNNESVLNPSETALWGVLRDNYTRGVNNTTNNNGNSYNINVSVQGGGSNQELTAMLTTALPEALERGVKTGDIDLGRMGIVTA